MNNTDHHKFALTTPLYYVNGVPHIGSAYTTMVADAAARFQRLQGKSVLFITGTDEHGQKIQRTAVEQNLEPQVFCDRNVESFKSLWSQLNIKYDRFSRTTAPNHQAIVNEFFERVWQQGDIYLDRQQGWYCVSCEEFKEERELIDDRHCAIHTSKQAEWRDEENYFFRLSNYQQYLEELYESQPDFIQPATRRNEVINFVKQGLKDFSISRVNLDWGFPVPVDKKHTIYVWFDALLGYVTALLEPNQEPTLDNALSQWWPINLHLIGKDILRFHAVYWPAMLASAGLPSPNKVFGHGFLTKDGLKMGKTLGNTVDPFELVDKYGADAVRYYFLKEIELGKDGDFNETRFIEVLNNDLANVLGNSLNRTLGMLTKYCQSKVPQLNSDDYDSDHPLFSIGMDLGDRVALAYENLQFSRACEEILTLVRSCNKYIDDSAPWSLFKQQKQSEVEHILYAVLESVRLSAYLLSPVIPDISSKIYQQLGFDWDFNSSDRVQTKEDFLIHSQWGKLSINKKLDKASPVFSKLELPSKD
ncbi:methionine--tRNA ligase [Pleurocapsa sp. FMAR1]|uniref:methionine--tRNA ligase n=1 Tax=Pleurocapsa sp. FMAR1 TaxID=3040204 RepID=UPI0029C646E4|nr:methionine--tRNA ligase [Pleurocapsa sp. FMAR1]